MLRITDQGILSRETDHGAFMPKITPLADGTFLACQHVGVSIGASDNRIEILRSTDECRTWTNEGVVPGCSAENGWTYRAPSIEEAPDGQLVMSATRFECTPDSSLFNAETEGLDRPEMILLRSHDKGNSWSEPERVPCDLPTEKYTANCAGGIQLLAPDRWMWPFETWKPHGYEAPPDQKAGAVFSSNQGRTWDDLTIFADDTSGEICWWDQMHTQLPDGRLYAMLWTHLYGTSEDLNNHWILSDDEGRTWSEPRATNLRGQVCSPIALADGRVAAIYNFRHDPHGIRIAVSEDLSNFDIENEVVVFDAGAEATLGDPESDNFLAEHMLIAFGKPSGQQLPDGDLLTCFWCTTEGITHTRWVRLRLD